MVANKGQQIADQTKAVLFNVRNGSTFNDSMLIRMLEGFWNVRLVTIPRTRHMYLLVPLAFRRGEITSVIIWLDYGFPSVLIS